MFSIVQQKFIHPNYLEIIGMSWRVMPYLIAEVHKGRAHWFPALRAIAGDEKPDEAPESFNHAVQIWTDWWDKRKYYAVDSIFKRARISKTD